MCITPIRTAPSSWQVQYAEPSFANAHSVFEHCLEHRPQVHQASLRSRCKHLRGRRLLLQQLGEIVSALAQLVEQPRVLDRDHRLVGEVLSPGRFVCR